MFTSERGWGTRNDKQSLNNYKKRKITMKQRIMSCFNKGAETYHSAAIVQAKVARNLAERLPFYSNPILEIGCGTGIFSQHLVSSFPDSSILLTDIASKMLAKCQQNLQKSTNIKYACMDGECLSTTTTFDLIVSSMTLHWFSNLKKGFEKIIHHLSPGGIFMFALVGENSLKEWDDICKKFNLPKTTRPFPSRRFLQENFPDMKIDIENVSQNHHSGYDFLHSLKNIGATAKQENNISLSLGNLRKIILKLNNPIEITYEILYGKYVK